MIKYSRMPTVDKNVSRFRLAVRRSKIHRYGLFAQQFIPARKYIIEYTGERLNKKQAKKFDGTSFSDAPYLFTVNSYWTIDGTSGGGAQYVNHSCDPNVYAIIRNKRIYFVALRNIIRGEELTLDYHLVADETIPCRCGSAKCRGKLNG